MLSLPGPHREGRRVKANMHTCMHLHIYMYTHARMLCAYTHTAVSDSSVYVPLLSSNQYVGDVLASEDSSAGSIGCGTSQKLQLILPIAKRRPLLKGGKLKFHSIVVMEAVVMEARVLVAMIIVVVVMVVVTMMDKVVVATAEVVGVAEVNTRINMVLKSLVGMFEIVHTDMPQ